MNNRDLFDLKNKRLEQVKFNEIMNQLMNDENFRNDAGKKAGDFVQNSPNATKMIMDYLKEILVIYHLRLKLHLLTIHVH